MIAWTRANSYRNPTYSLRAAAGDGDQIFPPSVLTARSGEPLDVTAGVDSHGDAVVLWNAVSPAGPAGLQDAVYLVPK